MPKSTATLERLERPTRAERRRPDPKTELERVYRNGEQVDRRYQCGRLMVFRIEDRRLICPAILPTLLNLSIWNRERYKNLRTKHDVRKLRVQ